MDSAIEAAHRLLRIGKAGLGKGQEASLWQVRAVLPLAGLLYAGSPMGCGGGISWVREAIENTDPEDVSSPGWAKAALLCVVRSPIVGQTLVATLSGLSPRQQDLLKLAMAEAVDQHPNGYATAVGL